MHEIFGDQSINKSPTIYQVLSANFIVGLLVAIGVPMTIILTIVHLSSLPTLSSNVVFESVGSMIMVLAFFAFLIVYAYKKTNLLFNNGIHSKGVITKINEGAYNARAIFCSYEIDGKQFVHIKTYLSNPRVEGFKVGDEVTIVADKNNRFRSLIKEVYI